MSARTPSEAGYSISRQRLECGDLSPLSPTAPEHAAATVAAPRPESANKLAHSKRWRAGPGARDPATPAGRERPDKFFISSVGNVDYSPSTLASISYCPESAEGLGTYNGVNTLFFGSIRTQGRAAAIPAQPTSELMRCCRLGAISQSHGQTRPCKRRRSLAPGY